MSETIWLDPPIDIEDADLCFAAVPVKELAPVGPLIKKLQLGKILKAIAKNYGLKEEQVPELLAGYVQAPSGVQELICASGYIHRPLNEEPPYVMGEQDMAALAILRSSRGPVTAQHVADRLGCGEAAAQAYLRGCRRGGYTVVGTWGRDPALNKRAYYYKLEE